MALRFEVAHRGGDRVVTAQGASLAVGDRTLVEPFTATLERQEVLGIVGRNGSGKSTLLRALLGEAHAQGFRSPEGQGNDGLGAGVRTGGVLAIGDSITAGYYRQDLSQVPLDRSLYDVIAGLRPRWERTQIQGHLGRFGFSGVVVQRRVDSLSGGERARLALAMLMLSGANLLVFDEPTNHLDVESIEALEEAIENYDGTVMLVSHDRELLRALTTRIWVLHDRRMTEFAGGFAAWEEVSAERAHAAKVQGQEEQALRQVHERQRVARVAPSDSRKALREAERALADAEAAVAKVELRIAPVTAALEDPALYTRPDGAATAHKLGLELDALKRSLDAALARWEQATQQVEAMSGHV